MKVCFALVFGFLSAWQLWGCWNDIRNHADVLDHVAWFVLLGALALGVWTSSVTDHTIAHLHKLNELRSKTIEGLLKSNQELQDSLRESIDLNDKMIRSIQSMNPFAPAPQKPRPEDIN